MNRRHFFTVLFVAPVLRAAGAADRARTAAMIRYQLKHGWPGSQWTDIEGRPASVGIIKQRMAESHRQIVELCERLTGDLHYAARKIGEQIERKERRGR